MIAAGILRLRLLAAHGPWNAFLIAAGAYLIVVVVVGLALPPVNEVPADFPGVVLWRFRIASAGAQLITWTTIGLLFGALARARPRSAARRRPILRRGLVASTPRATVRDQPRDTGIDKRSL
jgi:hypothetical protein